MNKLGFIVFLLLHILSFMLVFNYTICLATNWYMKIGGVSYLIILWINYYHLLIKDLDFKQYTYEIN